MVAKNTHPISTAGFCFCDDTLVVSHPPSPHSLLSAILTCNILYETEIYFWINSWGLYLFLFQPSVQIQTSFHKKAHHRILGNMEPQHGFERSRNNHIMAISMLIFVTHYVLIKEISKCFKFNRWIGLSKHIIYNYNIVKQKLLAMNKLQSYQNQYIYKLIMHYRSHN